MLKGKGELYKRTWYCSNACLNQDIEDSLDDEDAGFIAIDPRTGDPIQP